MSAFNLRGIPEEIMDLLKQEAKRLQISVNTLVLNILESSLGITREYKTHHELDHLAGTWSAADEKAFKENTQPFEQIDPEQWK